jgi:hypothetical protein
MGCRTYSTGGWNYRMCFNSGQVSQSKTTGSWPFQTTTQYSIGNMAWQNTNYAISGGSTCGGTPRAGSLSLVCSLGTSLVVNEGTLRTPSGGVACNGCCNYTMTYSTPSACAVGFFVAPSGMCLGTTGTSSSSAVTLQTCAAGAASQIWGIIAGGATNTIFNPATGMCLDVANAATASGTKIQLYSCNGTPAQKWALAPGYSGTIMSAVAPNVCAASSVGQTGVQTQNPCMTQQQQWNWLPIY